MIGAMARELGMSRRTIERWNEIDAADLAALARHTIVEHTRDQVIELHERTPFSRADPAAIREVVAGQILGPTPGSLRSNASKRRGSLGEL